MKVYILDIQDGNGCRLLTYFDHTKALEVAQDWFMNYHRIGDPALANTNENMDDLCDGKVVKFIDASIHLGESDLDMSGVLEVLEDAKHTLGRNQALLKTLHDKFGSNANIMEGYERANSRYLATEQALSLTADKLRKKS